MQTSHSGFFSFIFMVLIACSVFWWLGWDKIAHQAFTDAVNSGYEAKDRVINQVEGVTDKLKNRDAETMKVLDGDSLTN